MPGRGRLHLVLALAAAAGLVALATSAPLRPSRPAVAARYVSARGLTLRYARAGRGETVLLIHGFGESLLAWRSVFDALRTDYDVVALDLPGFGLSSKPATGYHNQQLAADVVAALQALGVHRAVLVGHSLGGAVAVAAALAAPDVVRALVLVDAAVVGTPLAVPDTARHDDARSAARGAIAEYEALRTRFTAPHDPAWLHESDSALGYLPAQDTAYRTAIAAVLRQFDFERLPDTTAARLRLPVLVLWGEYDPLFAVADGRRLAQSLPEARFEVVPRSWHRPQVERPEATARAIRGFLRSLPAAAGSIRP